MYYNNTGRYSFIQPTDRLLVGGGDVFESYVDLAS